MNGSQVHKTAMRPDSGRKESLYEVVFQPHYCYTFKVSSRDDKREHMTKINELKNQNIHAVRSLFFGQDVLTKQEVINETGLSSGACVNILSLLSRQKEILQIEDHQSTGGRRAKQYVLNSDYEHIGSATLLHRQNDFQIQLSIHDLKGQEVFNETRKNLEGSWDDVKDHIAFFLDQDRRIQTIELSIPGIVSDDTVRVCDWPELKDLKLVKELQSQFPDIDFEMENDVNLAVLGFSQEWNEMKDVALVYQPDTDFSGCGMIIGGRLLKGHRNYAGELRYLPMYREKEQLLLLKNDPEKLLKDQIVSVAAIVNPAVVGWHSDIFEDNAFRLSDYELPETEMPVLVHVKDMQEEIEKGLVIKGRKTILKKRYEMSE